MDIRMVIGDLLKAKEDYLMQQVNCVSNNAKGLSAVIFKKYPEADIYSQRGSTRGIPGTIIVKGRIINMHAQYYPGKGRYSNDSVEKRLEWFKECLQKTRDRFEGKDVSIAFPYKIGCGYGGGDWKQYFKILRDFDKENGNIKLVMYKLEEEIKTKGQKGRKTGKKRSSKTIHRSKKEEKPLKRRKLD